MAVLAAPTNLAAVPSATTAAVTFTAPDDSADGDTITDIEYQLGNSAIVATGATASTINLTGLREQHKYTMKVRAVNASGKGAWSSSISFTTTNNTANDDGYASPSFYANPGGPERHTVYEDPDD